MTGQRRSRGKSAEVVVRRGVLNQARWEQILDSAANEFYEKGYKAARLQDIAARVGLLTGSLYYYIESKENLLFALVESTYRKSLEVAALSNRESSSACAADRLDSFVRGQLRAQEETNAAFAQVVERDRKFLSPDHRGQIEELRDQLRGVVVEMLEQGMQDGEFDPTIRVDIAANTLFALINTTAEWATAPGALSWQEIGDWYVRLLLNTLAPDPRAQPNGRRRGTRTKG
jgi:AcrR family transcriptional regulator